ncbi:MAG TPA: prepilin peptidase, partial [Verrucomicrobiales bacterium]|nr:prepilin peptidase [Verrucomicrobiales bacterium]
VELLTGLLFLAAFLLFQWNWNLLAAWTFISLCVAGSYIDIDHQILPHEITWGGAAAGVVASAAIPNLIVEGSWWMNLLQSLGGAALGYVLIFGIVQLGKLAFGRLKLAFEKPVDWSVSQAEGAEEPVFKVADQEEGWSNIFNRTSDRLIIRAASAKLDDRNLESVILTMSNDTVSFVPQAGGEAETIPLENIKAMSGTCTSVEQPREAMGMGDANWMACVGAFFGWKAVLFTVLAGSVIGAFISMVMILLRRREWAARIPFGPYLASGAMIWLFVGPRLLEWYLALGRGGAPEPM